MELATLLPHLAVIRIARIEVLSEQILIHGATKTVVATCPSCHTTSRRLHGFYSRRVADVPLAQRRVTLHLRVQRFRCANRACARQTFADQTPTLAARYARRSVALQALLQDLGLTLGGRPSVRFACRHAVTISRMTPLRLVRALPDPPLPPAGVLGVDDFALRRGHHYGTLLTDLEQRRVIDLLPDRTAETFARWLVTHGAPRIICRDRGGDYARGAREGAPDAVQIADRFHLQKNSSEVLERVLARHPAALRAAVAAPTEAAERPDGRDAPDLARGAPASPHAQRLALYEQVRALRQAGWGITAIAALAGLARPTVRKYLAASSCPERPARRTKLSAGTAHATYLQSRWQEGCRDATVLWQELQGRGFTGSRRMVQRAVRGWRVEPPRSGWLTRRPGPPPRPAPPRPRPPSARQAVWLLLRPAEQLEPEQQRMRDRLLAAAPEVQDAVAAIEAFRRIVHDREASALEGWFKMAAVSPVPELRSFAAGLRRDEAAVVAAVTYPWSSGQVEGQICRAKLIKRQMYGRAKFDLLRKRVLLAG